MIDNGCVGVVPLRSHADRPAPVLSAEQLRLRYRNGALGVSDMSLQVGPGEVVAVFGANGAGKTSSMRAVSGLFKSEARLVGGTVTFDGKDVTNAEPWKSSKLGLFYIPERNKIFPNLTVTDNLRAIGRTQRGPRGKELYDRLFSLFPVLAEKRKAPAGRLSGGERQMLALGRGILSDPRVLIIDEMTLGLHHSLHGTLFSAVRQLASDGTGLILVDESTALAREVADYCYVITSGFLRDEGPSSNFSDNELLAATYVDA